MSFCVTWTGLNEKNIKHLYSTKEPRFIQRRSRLYNPPSLSFELSEHRPRRDWKRLHEYDERYGASLPRAPAFRTAPKDYVDGLVTRLTKRSRIKLAPRDCEHYQRSFAEYNFEVEEPGEETKRTKSQIKEIVSRLLEPNTCTKEHYATTMHESYTYSMTGGEQDTMTPVTD